MTRAGLRITRSSPRRKAFGWWPRVIDHRGITHAARGIRERRWWLGGELSAAFEKRLGGPPLAMCLVPVALSLFILIGIEFVDVMEYATVPAYLHSPGVQATLCALASVAALILVRITHVRNVMERTLAPMKERLLEEGRCLACGYLFEVDPTDPEAMNTCAECGAGWRSPIHTTPRPPKPARRRLGRGVVVTDAIGVEHRSRWVDDDDGLRPPPPPGSSPPTRRARWRRRFGSLTLTIVTATIATGAIVVVERPDVPTWTIFGACVACAFVFTHVRAPAAGTERVLAFRAENLLVGDPCPACGHPLGEPSPGNGCSTCIGCDGVWRVAR